MKESKSIFDNWNIAGVDNNPSCSPSFTISDPQMITYIDTYHWNYGSGTTAGGMISLRKEDGTEYGPWQVDAQPGMNGVPNAWWIARPNEVILAGTYEVIDSDPATWSQNSGSQGCGFSKIEGYSTSDSIGIFCDWTGTWDSNWGQMVLSQSGNSVTGTYTHDQGRIQGTVSGDKLIGTWSESPSYSPPSDAGDLELTMSSDCKSLSGNWKYGSEGSWSGDWTGTRLISGGGQLDQDGSPSTNTNSQEIGPEGGEIALPDGIRIVVPEGAVDYSAQFSVEKLDPADYLDNEIYEGVVLDVRASVESFNKPVEIRVPLPSYIIVEDGSAICGTIDDETGIPMVESALVDTSSGKSELVLMADHFSMKFFQWVKQSFGQEPFTSDPLTVPYYDQGGQPFCWAAATLMICQAVNYEEDAQVFKIIGRVGKDGSGLNVFRERFGGPLENYIKDHSGIEPNKKLWTAIDSAVASSMRSYIRRELAYNHNPVMVFSRDKRHAWVIVGYDGDKFYVHDSKEPLTMPPNSIMDWEGRLAGLYKGDTGLLTVVIPEDARSSNHPITAGINSGGVIFRQPASDDSDNPISDSNDMLYSFQWDYQRPEGYSIISDLGKKTEMLPADIVDVSLGENGIFIANADRNSAHEVLVSVDITEEGKRTGKAGAGRSKRLTIPPSSVTYLNVDPIKYSDFYVEGTENYRFGLTVYDGDEKVVETGFDFIVESGTFKIIRPISEVEKGIINYEYSFSVKSIGIPENARYEWYFDDGKRAEGKTVPHSFTDPRKYNVKVKATWDKGSKEDETVFEIAPDQAQVEKEEVTFSVFRTVRPLGKDPTTGQPWKAEKQACNNYTLTLIKDGKPLDMGVDGGVARGTNGVLTLYLIPGDYSYSIEYSYPRPPESGTKSDSFKVVMGGRNMIDVETSQISPDLGTSDGGRSVDSGQSVDSGTSVDSGRSVG